MIGYTTPLICSPVRRALLCEVSVERDRQDKKWGDVPGLERWDDHTYAAVLGEEFGECCKAWLERDTEALRVELIQTAAVAIAWLEELDNGGMVPRASDRGLVGAQPETDSEVGALRQRAPETREGQS